MPKRLSNFEREDRIRRKESRKELRKFMRKHRGLYWTKDVNKNYQNFHNPIIEKRDKNYSLYIIPNNLGVKNTEIFIRQNRNRIYDLLKVGKKVSYNLELIFVKFTDEEEEEKTMFLPKPVFILQSKKDFAKSFTPLVQFFQMKIAEVEQKGTGWLLNSIEALHVSLFDHKQATGGCLAVELPPQLKNREIFPLINSKREECLKDSLSYLTDKKLNFEGMDFPAGEKDMKLFEKNNPDFLVYSYSFVGNSFGIFYKNEKFHELKDKKTVLNILYWDNHFFPVKNGKLLLENIFSRRKSFVCKDCLTSFGCDEELSHHHTYCQKKYKVRTVLPFEGEVMKFKKLWVGEFIPFVCYLDAECYLEETYREKGENTIITHEHKLSYFGLLFYNNFTGKSEYKTFETTKDLIDQLIEYSDLLKTDIGLKGEEKKKADHAYLTTSECTNCGNEFTEDNHAVRDHCHFTGKFRSILCNKCNLKFQKTKILPVFCHNLAKYDEKLLIKEFYKNVKIIARNMENLSLLS